jgi:hypothetical protein
MNYIKIYEDLIDKAKGRELQEYHEQHHIIPRCLGGDDSKDNLIGLTPEEHYVAHQLLAKAFPHSIGLAYAASMMCTGRPNNKLYGWIRRRVSNLQSIKVSTTGNPLYNKRWVSNEFETILVDKAIADSVVKEGVYVAGKLAKRAPCGHLVKTRCAVCEDLKRKSYIKKKEDGKQLAHNLFEEFKNSNCKSVCEFAKIHNTSQPRLSALWKRYVDEYSVNRKHGKSFK